MFELADRLVGIYKTHDATKSVTIDPKVFAKMTPTAQPTPLMETTNLRL
jgi:structural maintenance of chromosome 4